MLRGVVKLDFVENSSGFLRCKSLVKRLFNVSVEVILSKTDFDGMGVTLINQILIW